MNHPEEPMISLRRHKKLMRRQAVMGDLGALFPGEIPETLLTDYPLTEEGLQRSTELQQKYVTRSRNIKRCWNRTQLFMPELMSPDAEPQDVLELSTGHGGMLEVARHFGHRVMGTDYANFVFSEDDRAQRQRNANTVAPLRALNDESFDRSIDDYGIKISDTPEQDWPYKYICESIDLPMTIFDAGHTPYPFPDKSYDVIMCFQAIEHYCHPDDWMQIIEEMCRIARKSIMILLNYTHREHQKVPGYIESFEARRLDLRNYHQNGFKTVACHIRQNQVLGFKLVAS